MRAEVLDKVARWGSALSQSKGLPVPPGRSFEPESIMIAIKLSVVAVREIKL